MASPHHRYKAGERILLGPESVLEVVSGAVALTVLHEDGAEVLLGLLGPGQVLVGHPQETSCLQLYALGTATVWVQPWSKAVLQPGFADRLRDRLRSLEAWAAMQARPSLERRLLGILGLLAGQFGRPASQGVEIEVGITHHQLASAVGATRSTVTRLLGRLRRRGLLIAVRHGRGERYCLPPREGAEDPERCEPALVGRPLIP
ncbi:MAG TPA: Crp/Fnr family transcriptional regulator [Thermoanaerobaculia bacterium]